MLIITVSTIAAVLAVWGILKYAVWREYHIRAVAERNFWRDLSG